jgi:hypothetical protein
MNGNNGIQPTIELATTNGNGYFPYPVGYGYGNNNNGGFFGGDGIWAIVLLALLFNNGGWGGFGGGNNNDFAWLSNGQKDIMNNTNNGFDTLHLSNQVEGVRDGIAGLSNQLCNCCADMNQTVSNGFFNAEVAANSRQVADMNQNFNNQIATLQSFNNLGSQLASCCCENRLGIANLNSTILSENCADRAALADGLKDVLINQTANTQRILDQLCNDKIDAKNEKIADLQREILMKDLQASQVAQTADLRANNAIVANQLVSELRSCPIPAQPVYGNTPIFECNRNGSCGCGSYYNVV